MVSPYLWCYPVSSSLFDVATSMLNAQNNFQHFKSHFLYLQDDFADNKEFITVHVYKGEGSSRIYYPGMINVI